MITPPHLLRRLDNAIYSKGQVFNLPQLQYYEESPFGRMSGVLEGEIGEILGYVITVRTVP
jgi:hypothetical protein